MRRLDLNCDLGEGQGLSDLARDLAIFPYVTSVNIACGFHAGTPRLMDAVIQEAVSAGLAIGAHPSLPDPIGFGRRAMAVDAADVYTDTLYQVGALAAMAAARGGRLRHVKPHGALYHLLSTDKQLATAFVQAVGAIDRTVFIVGPAASALLEAAEQDGLRTAREGFADRLYRVNGTLVPRTELASVHHQTEQVVIQAAALAGGQPFTGENGAQVTAQIETLCLHSDTPGAVDLARTIREILDAESIQISQLS